MSCGCGKPKTERQAPLKEVGDGMAQLLRTARSKAVPGVGYARRGVIHTVPDEMEKDLLATGEWEKVGKETTQERVPEPAPAQPAAKETTQERVTEPAPSEPAASAQASKPKAKSKKK